jgi:hypothetical protein
MAQTSRLAYNSGLSGNRECTHLPCYPHQEHTVPSIAAPKARHFRPIFQRTFAMRLPRFILPFCIATALFIGLLTQLVHHGMKQDGGTFVYPLDDAYIHMAISRNLALHGVWGITPYNFSGASSSPGWTLLLAALIKAFGVHLTTPLIVNAVAGLALLLLASWLLAWALPRAGMFYMAAALCVMVLVVPMPGLAAIGMEHMLHSVAMLSLIALAAWIASLEVGAVVPAPAAVALLFAGAAAGALRYETCFAIAAVMACLLLRRRLVLAVMLGVAAAIGPVAYGLYSRAHSGIMLPFSVVMKSSGGTHLQLGGLVTSPVEPILLVLGAVFLLRRASRAAHPAKSWRYPDTFLGLVLATLVMHALVGPLGWLMRYEAYLYVLGIVALALVVGDEWAQRRESPAGPRFTGAEKWVLAAVFLALLEPFNGIVHRMHHGWSDIAASIHDRYVEHLPQALFVERDMPNAVVIANDIGFLAFYADDAQILDPLGLGSLEPVQLERAHKKMDPEFLARWGARKKADLAIIHTDFPGMDAMVPAGWVLVESWCFPHNLVFQNHVQSFYAPDAASAEELRLKIQGFHDLAPEMVRYRFPEDGSVPPLPERGESAVCPVPVPVTAKGVAAQ